MDQAQMVSAVQVTARIPTHDEAEQAVRATLRVLGHRLTGGETHDIASQLSPSLAVELPAEGPGERFGLEEFYRRVAEEEPGDESPAVARRHARAVLAALKNSLTGHEYDHMAAQLPEEYADLLQTEPVQH
jgi:uncharacterized protein (DUF2267 family)